MEKEPDAEVEPDDQDERDEPDTADLDQDPAYQPEDEGLRNIKGG